MLWTNLNKEKEMKLGIDLTNVEPERESKTQFVPAGNYNTVIIEAEAKETAKKGAMLVVYHQITDGPHAGKTVADRINFINSNPDAQKWGLARLKTLCLLCKVKNPNKLDDTDELLGAKITIGVGEESFTNDEGKEIQTNSVKKVMELKELQKTDMAQAMGAPADAPTKAPAQKAKKHPWEK